MSTGALKAKLKWADGKIVKEIVDSKVRDVINFIIIIMIYKTCRKLFV